MPHTEVDLILLDGESEDFSCRLHGGERVAVHPVFERLDISPINRLRPRPLRDPRFVLDVHLGRLAAYLRLLGFDCVCEREMADDRVIECSLAEGRTILGRDVGLLNNGRATHGAGRRMSRIQVKRRTSLDGFNLPRCWPIGGLTREIFLGLSESRNGFQAWDGLI